MVECGDDCGVGDGGSDHGADDNDYFILMIKLYTPNYYMIDITKS